MATSDSPLNVPNVTLAVARMVSSPPSNADFSYFENFEGLTEGSDFDETYNRSVADASAVMFAGGPPIETTDDPIFAISEAVPTAPANSKIETANPSAGRTGNSVNSAMRFTYYGNPDLSDTAWSEVRWEMNPDYLGAAGGVDGVWLQYDEYVPGNFVHRQGTYTGRKVLAMFADYYSENSPDGTRYPTLIVGARSYTPDGSTIPGSELTLDYKTKDYDDNSLTQTNFWGDRGTTTPVESRILIHPDLDLGHWQRRTLFTKPSTAPYATDGIVRMWVQRQSEAATPMAPEQLANWTNITSYTEGHNYINKGYLLGYSNDGFDVDTTLLISNVIISSSINDIDQSAIT